MKYSAICKLLKKLMEGPIMDCIHEEMPSLEMKEYKKKVRNTRLLLKDVMALVP